MDLAPTLDEALYECFGGSSGAETAADAGVNEAEAAEATDTEATDTDSSASAPSDAAGLQGALEDAQTAMEDADAAMKNGDWAAYGEAQNRLYEALQRALEADGVEGTVASQPASGASASALATASAGADR